MSIAWKVIETPVSRVANPQCPLCVEETLLSLFENEFLVVKSRGEKHKVASLGL
jgi:hypothetical protein